MGKIKDILAKMKDVTVEWCEENRGSIGFIAGAGGVLASMLIGQKVYNCWYARKLETLGDEYAGIVFTDVPNDGQVYYGLRNQVTNSITVLQAKPKDFIDWAYAIVKSSGDLAQDFMKEALVDLEKK